MAQPTIDDIYAAKERIQDSIHRTPVMTSRTLDQLSGAKLFFKCENLQRGGAFKIRGATNAVFSLSDADAIHGVITHSSGNHGAALSLAARTRGIPAYVVMPHSAPEAKKRAAAEYGAEITFCEPTVESREATCAEVAEQTSATFVSSYNNNDIIAGQGTVGLEMHEQCPELNQVVGPVGGGALVAGVALAYAGLDPNVQVVGAEPSIINTASRSLAKGKIVPADPQNTIADGLRMTLGTLTFPIYQRYVSEMLSATEEQIAAAMRLIWERMKIVVEPSSATTLAVVLAHPERFRDQRVGLVLSGGNVDLDRLPFV